MEIASNNHFNDCQIGEDRLAFWFELGLRELFNMEITVFLGL